ncbi:MAG: response regulator [Elusimicrobiota bacterium]
MVKILIMDDESGLRNIVFNILKPTGHTLFTAEDGSQAIEVGKREIPDLALLDMRVPDMDGLEVLAELKRINPNVKCIMLSGFADVETAVNSLKLGAFDYISKPFKIDEVLKVVNKAVQALSSGTATAPVAAVKKEGMKTGLPVPLIAGAAAVVAVIAAAVMFLSSPSGMQEYSIPYSNPTGICWIQPNLWVSDWVTGNIYQHNSDKKLSIASVYKTGNTQPMGLAFDGEYLWSCNSVERRIYKHKLDNSLTAVAIYALPDTNPAGLYYDGANLWVIDSDAAKIYKHKMDETLSIVGIYDSPAVNPCGMFREGDYYFIGDFKTSKIYKVNSADLNVRGVYEVALFKADRNKLASVGWDGKYIWVSAEGVGKLYQLSMKALKEVKY